MTKKLKFNVGGEAADVDPNSDGFYDGPTPPKGVYRTQLKFLRIKDNSNGDPRISGICEIAEPKGSDKAKYNGYGIWVGLNITKQGAPYVNNFLDTFGFNRKAFWGTGGVTVDENDENKSGGLILKIGTKIVKEGAACRIRTKFTPAKGEWDERLEVAGAGFLPLSGEDGGSAWDEEDDEAVDAAADAESDEDEEAADTEEEGEEEDGEDEEAETEEEEAEGDEWTLEEISALTRAEIKELLKEWSPDFKVLKRHTDAELAAEVWDKMTGDEEESEDGEEEEDPF